MRIEDLKNEGYKLANNKTLQELKVMEDDLEITIMEKTEMIVKLERNGLQSRRTNFHAKVVQGKIFELSVIREAIRLKEGPYEEV